MATKQIVIRSSPFLFLKRFVLIEFFFALLPFAAIMLFDLFFGDVADSYQLLPFARSISFGLFSALAMTTLQVIIIIIVFISWYFPVYVLDEQQIALKRGNLAGDRKLVNLSDISRVDVKQGRFAKNFNYGSLVISTRDDPKQAIMRDIPEPNEYVDHIHERIDSALLVDEGIEPKSATQLIERGEYQHVEFKSSLAWDYYQQRANKALHQPVMKTLAAFLNSAGGYLLIGVDDDGQVLGLEPDLQTLRKPTLDAFETSFNTAFNRMIGAEFREFLDVAFPELDRKTICVIRVQPCTQPVFLSEKGDEKFYIRAGNASQSLTISQANRYIQRRFSD